MLDTDEDGAKPCWLTTCSLTVKSPREDTMAVCVVDGNWAQAAVMKISPVLSSRALRYQSQRSDQNPN